MDLIVRILLSAACLTKSRDKLVFFEDIIKNPTVGELYGKRLKSALIVCPFVPHPHFLYAEFGEARTNSSRKPRGHVRLNREERWVLAKNFLHFVRQVRE